MSFVENQTEGGAGRGEMIKRGERSFLVTYHPAAARRFPKLRELMGKDFRLLAHHTG